MKKIITVTLCILFTFSGCSLSSNDVKGNLSNKTISGGGNNVSLAQACIMNPVLNPQDINGKIYTIYKNGSDLYAGGQFSISGISGANIMKWNGTSWIGNGSLILSPFSQGEVRDIVSYNGSLYATGDIAGKIKRWDGNTWQSVGTGLNGKGWALAVLNNELYVGGDFTTAGGVAANHIAKWNGTSWSSVGSGVNGSVRELTVYNNTLFAGGTFPTSGTGSTINNIAQFNGTNWVNVDNGVDGQVNTMEVFNNELILGGQFQNEMGVNNANVRYMARYNGTNILAFSTGGTTDAINDFTVHNNKLVAGGGLEFGTVNMSSPTPTPINRIAQWDGTTWSYMQNDIIGVVYALESFTKLIVGGQYTSCNQNNPNIRNQNIAKWGF